MESESDQVPDSGEWKIITPMPEDLLMGEVETLRNALQDFLAVYPTWEDEEINNPGEMAYSVSRGDVQIIAFLAETLLDRICKIPEMDPENYSDDFPDSPEDDEGELSPYGNIP